MLGHLFGLTIGCTSLAYLTSYFSRQKNRQAQFFSYIPYILLMLVLSIYAGLRVTGAGVDDEINYRVAVALTEKTSLWQYILLNKTEPLFQFLKWICANWFHSSQSFLFISSLLTQCLLVAFFRRASFSFSMAIFMYVCGGLFWTSFVSINQHIALAIVSYSILWINKGRMWPYYMAVIIASMFHSSSIILLPLPLVLHFKLTPFKCVLVCCISLVVGKYFMSLLPLLNASAYGHYQFDDIFFYGVNHWRIIFWSTQYVLMLWYYFHFSQTHAISRQCMWWFLVFSLAVYWASISYVMFGRLQLFFGMPALALTSGIGMVFGQKYRFPLTVLWGMGYILYGYYVALHMPQYYSIFSGIKLWLQ